MQTALQWLWEQIPYEFTSDRSAFEVFEQAKEMEKQQIIISYIVGDSVSSVQQSENYALSYYERTYGSKGSETQGYMCPQTKKQCRDECCVSAEDCHIQAGIGVIFDCEQETYQPNKQQ